MLVRNRWAKPYYVSPSLILMRATFSTWRYNDALKNLLTENIPPYNVNNRRERNKTRVGMNQDKQGLNPQGLGIESALEKDANIRKLVQTYVSFDSHR